MRTGKIAVLLVGMLCASLSYANSGCDKPRDDFDGLYCLNKLYQEADQELNQNYKKLQGKLDAKALKLLKKSQLAWIEQRNTQCSRMDESGFLVNLRCATATTIERNNFLQDRFQECVSSGCQSSKLE